MDNLTAMVLKIAITATVISGFFASFWLYFFYQYLKEVDNNLGFTEAMNNKNISEKVLAQKRKFFKKEDNPSQNKKLAQLFFILMIVSMLGIMVVVPIIISHKV